MAMIQAKVEGKQMVETVETKHKAPVVDILEALKMSLAEVKKPIRSSTGTPAVPVEEDRPAKKEPQNRRLELFRYLSLRSSIFAPKSTALFPA